jgi:pimeloyl-ACP methyl ester carboxylesterase
VSTPPFLDLPAGVRDEPVRTGRGTFAALRAGPQPPEGRRPVVLVPGFTGSKEDFIAVLAPIGAAGFPVVAYDQRGQHGTTALDGGPPPEGWTMTAFGADLLALSHAVAAGTDDGVHLLGHSFGGLVARAAVLADPTAFTSLVLLSSGPASIGGTADERLQALAAGLGLLGLEAVWTIMQNLDREAGVRPPADPSIAAFMRRRFLAHDPAALTAMARLLATEPDRTDELAAVSGLAGKTLVAFGEGDDAWSPEIQRKTASRLGADTVSFPEAAHSPAAEAPEPTATALVTFWERSEGAGQPPLAEEDL